jgi:hypothetical protein
LNEIRKGYLRVKRNPVSTNMPIRNVKISSSKDTIISFNKIYIKRSADVTLTTTEGEYAETTTECTTAAHDATTEASAHKKRRRKKSAVVETETSASDHTASSSCEDNSFRNYSIAMSIVLVFLFLLIFFLYYLCYKDMIIETITKVKFFKYY